MKLKNGWPWSSIQNSGYKVSQEFIEKALKISNNTNWEDHKRAPSHYTICEYTRARAYSAAPYDKDIEMKELISEALPFIKDGFKDFDLTSFEFIYMLPKGRAHWHYDAKIHHYHGSKVMLLIENEDVDYYFAPWNKMTELKVPTSIDSPDIVCARMKIGSFYIFNHRIPHTSINSTDRPRIMLMFEFMPKGLNLDRSIKCTPQVDELEPLAPPIL